MKYNGCINGVLQQVGSLLEWVVVKGVTLKRLKFVPVY